MKEENIEEVTLYPLQPKQKQASKYPITAKYKLYWGAKGWGKSYWLRSEAARQAAKYEGIRGLILRRTYPEVYENTVIPMRRELPPGSFHYNESKGILTFHNADTPEMCSTIKFSYCRNLSDVLKYQGIEYDFIWIEELTHWTELEFRILMWCLRTSREGITPNGFFTTNPWGIGHLWVKRLWIDREFREDEDPEEYFFTPATIDDNQVLLKADPNYKKTLEALPEDEKKAYRYWDWNVFKGQYFKDYKSEFHECEPFAIPWNREKFIGLDYWYSNPSAVLFGAKDQDGNVYIYREIYVVKHLYDELLKLISDSMAEGEQIKAMVADPALKTKSPDTRTSFFDIALSYNFNIIPGTNDRIPGWDLLKSYLRIDETKEHGPKAKLQIFKTCTNLIRTLPALIYDKNNVEDLDTNGEDHAADALRYMLMEISGNARGMSDVKELNKKGIIRSGRIIKKRF